MHLSELLGRRQVPAAGVFLALTRRCPLGCRHCSTRSVMTSPQLPAALLRRFTGTFSGQDHPEFLLLTGGEPLLRPRLVRELATAAHAAGTRSYLLTGAYFATMERVPAQIRAALESVDHVAVSIDKFHESRVPRRAVFRALRELLAAAADVSIQACGTGAGDPYIDTLLRDVRREFGGRVPVLVTTLRPVGRAEDLFTPGGDPPEPPEQERRLGAPDAAPWPASPAVPCDLAAWPVVGFDGTIAACCNTDVLEPGAAPAHLRLGHISSATWPEVRRATVSSPVLRVIRTSGPVRLARRCGLPPAADYCGTCRSLADHPHVSGTADAEVARPAFALIEQQARSSGPVAFARRHGAEVTV